MNERIFIDIYIWNETFKVLCILLPLNGAKSCHDKIMFSCVFQSLLFSSKDYYAFLDEEDNKVAEN